MRGLKLFFCLVALIVLANSAGAATLQGTIYDLSLKKLSNARVEINTSPKQFLVAQNGTYSFNVPNGNYKIRAQLIRRNDVVASVEENITIRNDGYYTLDLILFPNIEEGIEDPGIDLNGVIDDENSDTIFLIGFIILFVSGIIVGIIYYSKTRKKENSTDKQPNIKEAEADFDQIKNIIAKEGGRATQKDIRKQIPLSEAKISLLIAEMEHKGIVEKIKKGRGNIIILKDRR